MDGVTLRLHSSNGCVSLDTAFTADLEEHSDVAVTYKDTAEGKASEQRSKKLYAILSGIFRNRPLRLLRQVADNNGLEVWRQLHSLYTPKTKVRSMAISGTIMSFPAFSKERTLLEQIQVLERLGDEYQKTTGANISEDILQTILVRSLPKAVQQHIQLGMTNTTSYQEVRERVVAYEKVSSTWSKDRILMECGAGSLGAVTSYAAGSDTGPSPMEVNLLQKGKGKKGKNAGKGKGQDSGKGKSSYGKGKGKGQDSGKGKGPNKGGGKAQSKGNVAGQTKQKLDANICAYCGKHGHWQRDCYKKKADQQAQQGQVRVVGEAVDNKQDTAHSTASFSTGSGSQAVRLVSVRASDHHVGHFEDLTVHSLPTSPSSSHGVRVLREIKRFDMSVSDGDGGWTLSPDCEFHLRAVSNTVNFDAVLEDCDIILDSGADTSALALKFASVGIEGPAPTTSYVDAQGAPLDVRSTRLADVRFGDVIFRERFIVSDITCPLLSLGAVLRSGWNIMHVDGNPCLVKDDRKIDVLFRNNSLRARGQIAVLSQFEPNVSIQPAVRVLQLGMVLRCLVPGWNRINPHLYAIKTVRPTHVDTTLCPSDELMWLRSTLVFRDGNGWEVDEFCEPIADMRHNLEEEFFHPESVVEVITLAHKYAMQDEHLGFFMYNRSTAGLDAAQADAQSDGGYSASVAPDPMPDEAPANKDCAEPLEEDRVVPFSEDSETVMVDGILMSTGCTLKVLRAGCSSLGLSGRGGKSKCLKRMVEHVRAQTLLAAHGAEIKMRNELERAPVAQSKPEEPSQQEVENHGLTHEPFRAWCPLCVQYRAKQDPHRPSTHESSGHSVLSMDFWFLQSRGR